MTDEEKKKLEQAKGKPMGADLLSPNVTDYGTPQTYADKLRAAGIKPVGPNDSPQATTDAPVVKIGKDIKNFVMGDNPWARKDREMAAIPGSPQFQQPSWATPSASVAPATAAATAEATAPAVVSAPEAAQPKIYAPDMMQRNMDMLKWRLAYGQNHGVDSKAAQNEYDRGMAGITNAQNVFRQHDEDKAARKAGVLVRGNDGQDYALPSDKQGNSYIPKAGSLSDGSGVVEDLHESRDGLTRSVKNPDGTTTYHTASGGTVIMGKPNTGASPARSATDTQSVAQNILNYQDLSGVIPRGVSQGSRIEGVPSQQFLENNANRIAKESGPMEGSTNSDIQKEINARITGTPDLTQALTELNRRGVINSSTPASVIEKKVAEYNRNTEPSFGDLLTKLDTAAAKPGFNRVPVAVDRSAPSEPDENFTTGPANVTATPESVAQYNADRDADAKAREVLAAKSDNTFGLPTTKEFMAGVDKQAEEMRNSPIVQEERIRQARYDAKNAMEAARAPQPNGDPLRDAQIAANIGKAAGDMAKANGVTDEQLKANPGLAARYLPPTTGVNALGSSQRINDMAMETLRGTALPNLINQAISQNIGGSQTAEFQNKRAVDQISKQATIDQKDDATELAKQTAQGRADDRASTASANLIKGLEGRLDRVDTEIGKNTTDLGDIAKKQGAATNLERLNKKRSKIQADLDKAQGLEPEEGPEASKPASADQPNMVTIRKPDGTTGKIPAENLDKAIKLGAKKL